jgi:aspartyl-tRNA synthetase
MNFDITSTIEKNKENISMVYLALNSIQKENIGQDFTVGGFTHNIRDHGGLIFIDLRNDQGLLQCVADPSKNPNAFKIAEQVGNEYVLKISGKIVARSPETINPDLPTGQIELEISELEIVSEAKPLPFDIHGERNNMAGEEIRLKYRYLDLRREKLHQLLKRKHDLILNVRNWFSAQGFMEVQTPILANSTPEGARDFLVPSRLNPGHFYALPQAPQQYKQLLMVGGIGKYFQIAPCFRDEDPRSDRHPGDFYQIDGEIAWADEADIYEFSTRLITEVYSKFSQKTLLDPNNVLPKIGYFEAMDKYGSDKPDIRFDLAWQDAKGVFAGSDFKVFADLCDKSNSRIQALVVKGQVANFSRSDLDRIQDLGRDHGLPGIAYIQYFEDGAKSPLFKFLGEAKSAELKTHFGLETGDLILFVANSEREIVWKAQNAIRLHIAKKLELIDDTKLQFVWIDSFPMFEKNEETGEIDFTHNPFSSWQGGIKALEEAQANDTLNDLVARQYDIGVNGYEVLSGGVRNTDSRSQLKAFEIAGYTTEEVQAKFGHMLQAYSYGSPNHAGFAWGLDRLFMVLEGEDNIREIIAFPKNGKALETMTGAPGKVSAKQLKELGIKSE